MYTNAITTTQLRTTAERCPPNALVTGASKTAFAPSAAPLNNPENQIVALPAALGSKSVEIPAIQTMITRGLRASIPAKVSERHGLGLKRKI